MSDKFNNDDWIYYMAQIGHEIRTPLNVIKGFGELIESESIGPLNDAQKKYMGKILTSSDDLLFIISDILNWAKLSTGQMLLDKEVILIKELFLELEDFFRLEFIKKNLSVSYTSEVDLTLYADRGQIRQALINIIGNTLKYVDPGNEVFVSAKEDVEKVYIEVRDTGKGIPSKDVETIMQPFVRGMHKNEEKQGAGLGLWISRAMIENNGGSLEVYNHPEGGAVFLFAFLKRKD